MNSKIGDLKLYDKIIGDVVANVATEAGRTDNKIYLKWFDPNLSPHKVYFYGAMIISDIYKIDIYLDMPIFKYIFFKLKHWKHRKRIKWISVKKVPLKVVPVQTIIDHIENFNEMRPEANQMWYDLLNKYYEAKGRIDENNHN